MLKDSADLVSTGDGLVYSGIESSEFHFPFQFSRCSCPMGSEVLAVTTPVSKSSVISSKLSHETSILYTTQ